MNVFVVPNLLTAFCLGGIYLLLQPFLVQIDHAPELDYFHTLIALHLDDVAVRQVPPEFLPVFSDLLDLLYQVQVGVNVVNLPL